MEILIEISFSLGLIDFVKLEEDSFNQWFICVCFDILEDVLEEFP